MRRLLRRLHLNTFTLHTRSQGFDIYIFKKRKRPLSKMDVLRVTRTTATPPPPSCVCSTMLASQWQQRGKPPKRGRRHLCLQPLEPTMLLPVSTKREKATAASTSSCSCERRILSSCSSFYSPPRPAASTSSSLSLEPRGRGPLSMQLCPPTTSRSSLRRPLPTARS